MVHSITTCLFVSFLANSGTNLLTIEEVVARLRFDTSASNLPSVALQVEEYEDFHPDGIFLTWQFSLPRTTPGHWAALQGPGLDVKGA